MPKQKLRIIPLGGLGEIGKNMMVLEYGNDIVVIDAGLMFPENEMLGIDLVIPDISYLLEKAKNVRGIIITHGHEDHTGGLPYILPRLNVPLYSTRLTQGLISVKLNEHRLLQDSSLNVIQPGDILNLGAFRVEFFSVSHSIPDGVGLALHTPVGTVVHTGDFKFDHTPVDGKQTDFSKLAKLGGEGVLVLLSDSTRVETQGYTPSEQIVGETLGQIISQAPGRVIIATFASLISRVQQVIDAASRCERKVAITGRSMIDNARMAMEMGYLNMPPGVLVKVEEVAKLPKNEVVIVSTGSQGEPTSALTLMAIGEHRHIRIVPGDTVILSAAPIPGNEQLVNHTIDNLFKLGANVLYSKTASVHVSGHGSQEEQKMMINLVRPRFFVPIHGEYRHLKMHAQLALSMLIPEKNIFVIENGHILELGPHQGRVVGRVPAGYVYVDGLGIGDIGHVVLRDRKQLSQDGVVVVSIAVDKQTSKVASRPDIVSRGFVFMRESEELIEEARELVIRTLDHRTNHLADRSTTNNRIKDVLSKFFYGKTKRRPMILPLVIEV